MSTRSGGQSTAALQGEIPAACAKPGRIPVTDLAVRDTHRLIASRFSSTGTVLSRLSGSSGTVAQLMELDDATNDRFLGEEGLLPGIGIHELVYGVRYAHIVNAAFTHASPAGGRFNTSMRGAWYCSLDRATSVAEIAYHKLLALEEVSWPDEEVSTSDDYLADLTSSFHDLREPEMSGRSTGSCKGEPSSNPALSPAAEGLSPAHAAPPATALPRLAAAARACPAGSPPALHPGEPPRFARYLRAGPIPRCYARPQALADRLLHRRSNGIVYPSVRDPAGTCIVVFRPALVYNVRRGARLEFRLRANQSFRPSEVREVPVTAA